MLMDIAPFLKIRDPWNIFAIDIADDASRVDIIIADCRISETGHMIKRHLRNIMTTASTR